MEVFLRAKSGEYNAIGEWSGKSLIVKKGSVIRNSVPKNFKFSKQAELAWINNVEDGIVKKDVAFNSPSTAAQFVTKNSVNGWIVWKTEGGRTLKEIKED